MIIVCRGYDIGACRRLLTLGSTFPCMMLDMSRFSHSGLYVETATYRELRIPYVETATYREGWMRWS